MSFFAQVGADPYKQQAGQLGQAFGQGLGVHFKQGEMQQQQGQLAKMLFGSNAQQFAELSPEQQQKMASYLQDQQKLNQENQLKEQNQNQLAQILFGNQSSQFSGLSTQEQLKISSYLQDQQKLNQENELKQQNLVGQQNLAKHLFPENAEQLGNLPVQQQISLANLFKKQKDSDLKQKVIGSLFPENQAQGMPKKESDLLSDAQIATVSTVDPNLAKILQQQKDIALREQRENKKEQKKEFEKQKPFETAQRSFNSMAKLLKKGNLGLGSEAYGSAFGGETAKDTAQFSSATGGLEAMLVDMVSRGTLSNARFKYITETLLPKPGDRDKVIEGKLVALADLLGLDASELTGNQSNKKSDQQQSLSDIWK